jgi:hypothetical protein
LTVRLRGKSQDPDQLLPVLKNPPVQRIKELVGKRIDLDNIQ